MQLLNELYHEDKGPNHSYTVFLSPKPPGNEIKQELAHHPANSKLIYLQGSPFKAEVGLSCWQHGCWSGPALS